MTKPLNVIIHGHFYQPPREDPWTNIIYDQDSAYPFRNWNERITRECYGPNCYSRVLDKDGKITDIINNYKYISFNFGPTLLSYLEKEEPEIYGMIIEADRDSVEKHGGHGNAIAQVFNHVILPLQNDDDKRTQIIWGLKDFEKRFGRKSEGIWLSETAIDNATADILIEYGVRFTILSPGQADRYRKIGDEKWIKNSEHPVSTTRSYKLRRDKGDLAVFFFDKALSTAVSFEHILHSSDNFANAIMGNKNLSDEEAVIIASDGEVYGHHEPFADMCLASLVKNYHLKNHKLNFMNFGEYLEEFPPLYEIQLSAGEDGKGSSWSCFHGVGRWYKNCGCHTGGKKDWDQRWRTPLRESFDIVKTHIDRIFYEELKDIVHSPLELRNDYIELVLAGCDKRNTDFLRRHLKTGLNEGEAVKILTLLESQKYSMFMYTSCGWFFSEISGIETVQNMRYAYKAIDLLGQKGEVVKKEFENKMEEAVSNIREFKNGRWILENWVYDDVFDLQRVANNFIMMLSKNMGNTDEFEISGYFGCEEFESRKIDETKYTGKILVNDRTTGTSGTFYFLMHEEKPGLTKNYIGTDKAMFENIEDIIPAGFENKPGIRILYQHDLLSDIKERILELMNEADSNQVMAMSINQINRLKEMLLRYQKMKSKIPHYLKNLFKNSAESYFHYLAGKLNDFPANETYSDLLKIFEISKMFHIELDADELKKALSTLLYKNVSINPDPFSVMCDHAVKMLNFCYKAGLLIEKSRCENIIFNYLKNKSAGFIRLIDESPNEEEKMINMLKFRKILSLSELFNINTDEEKKLFFKYF